MYGPTSAVKKAFNKVSGSQSLGDGAYGFSCDDFPTVQVTWGDNTYDISDA